MRGLLEIFSPIQGPSSPFAANHSIVTSPTIGHRDIVSKLTSAQGNYTFAIIAVEYFIKWNELKLVSSISSTTIKKFF
jgi:hypothetical protein